MEVEQLLYLQPLQGRLEAEQLLYLQLQRLFKQPNKTGVLCGGLVEHWWS